MADRDLQAAMRIEFTVQLRAIPRDGKPVLRKLVVPLQIDPMNNHEEK